MGGDCGIYQIVHKASGKTYIGGSICLSKREKAHFSGGTWSLCINNKIRNSGLSFMSKSRFHFGIIEYFDTNNVEELRQKEKIWINLIPKRLSLNKQKPKEQ